MFVSVYGTLKRGFSNGSLLKGSEFIGECYVPGKLYVYGLPFLKVNKKYVCGEGVPYMFEEDNLFFDETDFNVPMVSCEMYRINKGILPVLDTLEGFNGKENMYERVLVKCLLREKPMTSWVYHYPGGVVENTFIESGKYVLDDFQHNRNLNNIREEEIYANV